MFIVEVLLLCIDEFILLCYVSKLLNDTSNLAYVLFEVDIMLSSWVDYNDAYK